MPGCGKSTFGKRVAEILNMKFFDLDKEITTKENMTVNDIFQQHGEPYFREAESNILKEITDNNNSFVMATGGGTPCFADNLEIMNTAGNTIYINASVNDLLDRLSVKGINKRPLLKQLSPGELEAHLTSQLNNRKIFYEKCQHILAYNETMETDMVELIRSINKSK